MWVLKNDLTDAKQLKQTPTHPHPVLVEVIMLVKFGEYNFTVGEEKYFGGKL